MEKNAIEQILKLRVFTRNTTKTKFHRLQECIYIVPSNAEVTQTTE